ncbi:MAG: alanine racemase [Syntrophomonas sp.]
MDNIRPTWAEIDLTALQQNLTNIKKAAAPAKVMAIVKANAYGHGILEISQVCIQQGVDFLGVATLEEALKLRESGVEAPILVLGYIPGEYAQTIIKNDIRPTVFNWTFAQDLSRAAIKLGREAKLHIKIDTGMGRLGFSPNDDSRCTIEEIAALPGVGVEGIFTHLSEADGPDKEFSRQQLALFSGLVSILEKNGLSIALKHCSNSAALMDIPEARFDMVRAGIILYGTYPSRHVQRNRLVITPVMTLKSRISYLKTLETGHPVSYGRTYHCEKPTLVATVPLGYADGYSRLLSNRAWAVVRGQKVKLIGTVCMDQCMFDVSGVDGVKEGDEVILFGRSEDGVTADNLAEIIGTINYEVLCAVSSRVPRIYTGRLD